MDPFIPGLPRDPEPFAQILDRFLFPAPPIDKLVPAFHGIPLFKGHLPSFGGLLSFFLLPMSPVCFVTHVPGPYQGTDSLTVAVRLHPQRERPRERERRSLL